MTFKYYNLYNLSMSESNIYESLKNNYTSTDMLFKRYSGTVPVILK